MRIHSPRVGIGGAYTTTEQKFLGWLDSRKSVIVFKFGGKVGLKYFYKLLYFRSLTEFYDALKVQALGFQHMAELLFNLKAAKEMGPAIPPNVLVRPESDPITSRIEPIKAWVRTLFCRSDAAKIGTVRQRTADGIGEIGANKRGGIGAVGIVRVVTGQLKFIASLPPTVLATNHAGHDIWSNASTDLDGAVGTFNDHPLFVGDAEAGGAVGMNIRRRLRCCFAQAWQRALLAMHVGCELCVGENQRIVRCQLRAAQRSYGGFHIFGHARISVRREFKGIELDLF